VQAKHTDRRAVMPIGHITWYVLMSWFYSDTFWGKLLPKLRKSPTNFGQVW